MKFGHSNDLDVKDNLTADDLRKRLHITLNHEVEVLEHQFSRNQVNTITGTASFLDKNTIQVLGEDGEINSFSATNFLLAVGTKPYRPDYIPFNDIGFIATKVLNNYRLASVGFETWSSRY